MGSQIELYRCYSCGKLSPWNILQVKGRCSCGGTYIRDGFPSNLIENIKVLYWKLKFRG